VSDAEKERVIKTVLYAITGGDAGAEKALRLRIAGEGVREAAAAGGIGEKRLLRMAELYAKAIENLEIRASKKK